MKSIIEKIITTKIFYSKKKEIARYALSFFLAWLVAVLISDFPYFRNIIISLKLDVGLTHVLIALTENSFNLLGFETFSQANYLKILDTPGLIFAYGCLGFREMAFFSVFVLFQSGSAKHKLWYIPSGLVLLIVLNVVRAVIIGLGQYNNPANTDLIHDIISPILMYPAILFLWLFWLSTFGKPHTKNQTK